MSHRSADFEALLARYAELEPHTGFSDVWQLEELEDADLAVVLRECPSLIADAMCDDEAHQVADRLAARTDMLTRATSIGSFVIASLRGQAMAYFLRELVCYCAEINDPVDERALAARDAGVKLQGPL